MPKSSKLQPGVSHRGLSSQTYRRSTEAFGEKVAKEVGLLVHQVGIGDMSKPHRIAAGGLIFKDDSVLLVRYCNSNGRTYLIGPGGELKDNENVVQAIVRETMEETCVRVQPKRVVIIEDLNCTSFKMIKIWMVCEVVDGSVRRTHEAEKEGIIEAAWYTRAHLTDELVYPLSIIHHDWDQLRSENWQAECLPSRNADF